jgi:hypothetical protein
MSTIQFQWRGKTWEITGRRGRPNLGESVLVPLGEGNIEVRTVKHDWRGAVETYLFVRPVPARHVYGGIVFEETGERREVSNEWYLAEGQDVKGPTFEPGRLNAKRSILRPVAAEEQVRVAEFQRQEAASG